MTSINPLQSNSALSRLLTHQQTTQTPAVQANSSQSSVIDSLSLSNAALQALQGLGLDPTQLQQTQTYTAKGHHHHHHGVAAAQQGTPAQQASASQANQGPQVSQTENPLMQAKS
jgi:hypothetical protein